MLAPPLDLPIARTLGTARDHDALLELLMERKAALGLPDSYIDEAALCAGAWSKFAKREKNLGRQSLDGLLLVLGVQLVLVEDPERVRMMQPRWERRENGKVHEVTSRIGKAAINRARRTILRELNTLARACG